MPWMNDNGYYEQSKMRLFREMSIEQLYRERTRYQQLLTRRGVDGREREQYEWNLEKIEEGLASRSGRPAVTAESDVAGLIWQTRDAESSS